MADNLRRAMETSTQYETTTITKGGVKILIRPIKPEDAPLLVNLFNTLSKRSIYYRFFSALKSLPPDMLARFTQIDNDRDIALVALDNNESEGKILGVARLMGYQDRKGGEIAVTVGDPWQGKGIGSTLMEHLMAVTKKKGTESLYGLVLSENSHMLALARKLGYETSCIRNAHQVELKLDLGSKLLN